MRQVHWYISTTETCLHSEKGCQLFSSSDSLFCFVVSNPYLQSVELSLSCSTYLGVVFLFVRAVDWVFCGIWGLVFFLETSRMFYPIAVLELLFITRLFSHWDYQEGWCKSSYSSFCLIAVDYKAKKKPTVLLVCMGKISSLIIVILVDIWTKSKNFVSIRIFCWR